MESEPFRTSESRICFHDGSRAAPECSYFTTLFGLHRSFGDEHFVNLSVVHLPSGVNGIELAAAANYVDGHASETAIWMYRADLNALVLAFTANFGNESNGHLIQQGPLDGYFIGVRKWGSADKTRWDAQKYRIEVYRYDAVHYKYVEALSYATSRDYSPEGDSPDIYEREMPTIEARLRHG